MPTRQTLLLADDSPTIRKVVSLTFEDEGLRVVAVGSGGEALAHLEQDAPDIVLADVHMPAPSGYELCARIKRDERLRGVPVLLLVGAFEPFDEAEARRVGADGVLTKPFQSIRDLVSKVGGLLGGHPESKASDEDVRAEEDARAEPHAEARHAAATHPSGEASPESPALPDFDLDDESIETIPADSYAARAEASAAEGHDVEAFTFPQEETSAEGTTAAAQSHAARQESHSFAAAASGFGSHANAAAPPPAVFDSRPVSSPAEDSLLDLDDIDPAPVADADDFILDFDEEPAFAQHAPAAFEAASVVEAAPYVEEAMPVEVSSAHVEEPPAEISPANLSSAWQDFNHSEISSDAALVEETAAAPFVSEESAQTVEPADFEAAPVAVDSVAAPSDFEIVTPSVVEDRGEPAHVEAVEEPSARESVAEPAVVAAHESAQPTGVELSQETIDAIARRVVEQMSDRVLRDIAWEVVPDLAERLIRQRLEEESRK